MGWLDEAISNCSLTEKVESYLLGRGAKDETIRGEGMVTWRCPPEAVPDLEFRKKYGVRGELLEGMLICPVWAPRGLLIGFEGRTTDKKFITDFRLPSAEWNPFWLGLRMGMPKIWAGGDVWVGEGLFDKCPLEWVVPDRDAVLASVRAKLSRRHVEFLRRFCKGWVHMVYDRDEGGRNGTVGYIDKTGKKIWGALDSLKKAGLKCRDVPYSGGKDPGVIWDHGGVSAMKTAFPI